MLIDRTNLPRHVFCIVLALVGTVVATVWLLAHSARSDSPPSGSTCPGLTFGILSGVIIIFELLLWPRKKFRVWRVGRAEVWMTAHIWLGLLTVPLIVYHSGFRFGGPLSTVLMVLFLVVIGSGVFGLVLQQSIPSRMLEDVPVETIYSQMDHVLTQLRAEAERLVRATCGATLDEESDVGRTVQSERAAADMPMTVGSIGHVGRVQGRVLQTVISGGPVPGTELLRDTYRQTIEPYVLTGSASGSSVRSPQQAAVVFRDLRTKLDRAAHPTIDALENLCDQRRQLEHQARMHFWLHSWLWFHLPLSVALVALMFVHVWYALKYV